MVWVRMWTSGEHVRVLEWNAKFRVQKKEKKEGTKGEIERKKTRKQK